MGNKSEDCTVVIFTRIILYALIALLMVVSMVRYDVLLSARDTASTLSAKKGLQNIPGLSPIVLTLSLNVYQHLFDLGLDKRGMLTIIDYSKPSSERRLWVIDLKKNQVLFYTYVAHGKESGDNRSDFFSNRPNSFSSSIGVYLTGNTYYGVAGYSLRLFGLDKGFNDEAFKRGIVMHPAWYVGGNFSKRYGQLGHSLGCFAINPNLSSPLIDTIKGGTVLIGYYPNENWLQQSRFL